jgi:phytoene dehydrogenase-like protein
MASYDAVVVGAGPNGLAAAIHLAQKGLSVHLFEANPTVGGGASSAELTLPGFLHDVCSAIHPLALGSPFFRTLPLEQYGLEWIQPEFPLAHPLPNGEAIVLKRLLPSPPNETPFVCSPAFRRTHAGPAKAGTTNPKEGEGAVPGQFLAASQELGGDSLSYERLIGPLVSHWEKLMPDLLGPLLRFPRHPLRMARFGLRALRSTTGLAKSWFQNEPVRALFAGLAAHSFLRLEEIPSAAFGIVLGILAHAVGWPLPRGGAGAIAYALAAHLRALGGEISVGTKIESLDQLPVARGILLDVTPRQFIHLAERRLSHRHRLQLEGYRYGPGVFKLDYALAAPIPWEADLCSRAGTVHLGGTLAEIARAESEVAKGNLPEHPFVLVTQPTLFDPTRAPAQKHVAWAYTHVPNGSTFDMTERIEKQLERFAPGFRDCVLAQHAMAPADFQQHNANLIGGDINGGLANLWQLVARPALSRTPYRTAVPGVYLCSSSTPPGGGVHGMCGFHAAETLLRDLKSSH